MPEFQGKNVLGIDVDENTRCRHYHGKTDIVAIRFKCCSEWFPCFACHADLTSHEPEVWPADEFNEIAILCGACGNQFSINDYLDCNFQCANCCSNFNPGCANHYHLYFQTPKII